MSIHVRRRIESIFGWMKTVGGMRKTRFRGWDRVGLHFSLTTTAYNLVRMSRLWGGLMGIRASEVREIAAKSYENSKKHSWEAYFLGIPGGSEDYTRFLEVFSKIL